MANYLKRVFMLVACWVLVSGSVGMAGTMYAKKDHVRVTVAKSPTSRVVATLKRGEPVAVIKKSGRHYQVKLKNGRTGWVFKFKLTDKKPTARRGRGGLSALTGKSMVMAKEARAGGSIRGLKETTQRYVHDKHLDPVYQKAVEAMEQRVISDEELARFQREGGVGEFSGGGQ
ncbi:MAG: hypothetical protein D6704_06200 [Nitrospirae bacterium]|nr:MAG: hypothetical protein D6704_06200 [Nitrospirota bacterium]